MAKRHEKASVRVASLAPILVVNFVGTLGFSIVLPFLVFLVTEWGGNALIYGVMGATYSAFQLVGAPILGRWSDTHGRRKILLLSQLGTLFSWMVLLVAVYLPVTELWRSETGLLGSFTLTLPLLILFVARALDGLTGGNISVANAYLADITPEEKRSVNFGKMAISANLGFIVGPALAGVLGGSRWGAVGPVGAALAVSAIATLIIVLKLPESKPRDLPESPGRRNVGKVLGHEQRDCFEPPPDKRPAIRQILSISMIPYLLTLYFLVMLGFNFFYIAFPIYAATRLEWTVTEVGIFFSVLSLAMIVVQGPVLKRAAARWSNRSLVSFGSFVLSASFLFFTAQSAVVLYAGALLLALGNGLMWTSLLAILSNRAGSRLQGAVQGFAGSSGAVASIMGLLIGGLVFNRAGSAVFVLSAIIIFSVFLLSFRCSESKSS
ncbi:MAG: MFS transporter [Candidatus Latescibacterota bacterium]|jgi:MFS family permease